MSSYNISAPQGAAAASASGIPEAEEATFTKTVEILRALELTAGQFEKEFGGIKKLPFEVEGDIEDIGLKLMEEFKKVYSLGTGQLESFIGALDGAGEELDEYSILYYISLLENGPYEQATGQITGKLTGDGEVTVDVFKPGPDIMGINANWNTTNSSSPIWFNDEGESWGEEPPAVDAAAGNVPGLGGGNVPAPGAPAGAAAGGAEGGAAASGEREFLPDDEQDAYGPIQDVPNVTLGKSPKFLTNLLSQGTTNTRGVFRAAVKGSMVIDENTLPYIDKNNEDRREEEKADGRNKANPVHGNLMVKDVEKIINHKNAEEKIVEQINEHLGDKAFRLFLFRKLINYFNKEQNLAHSTGEAIDRKVDFIAQEFDEKDDSEDECINVNAPEKLKRKTASVETDMFGRTFDSVERREFEMKTNGANGENLFKLYTIKGQLGSGEDVEEDPM